MPGSLGSFAGKCTGVLQLLALFASLVLIPSAEAQQASVRSELSTSTITRDETVVLTITAIGIDAELDASSLNDNFDVVGRSSSREIRTISNGNNQITNTSVVTWSLELLPRDVGVFTVPAVKVGDLSTQLLSLTVNEVPQGAKRDVFIEATVDTKEPWVQSQVLLTVSIFQAVDIVDGGLDIPSSDDLVIERFGEDTRSRQISDGREYNVTQRRYALFAQKSGTMQIDPITLSVTVPADPNRVRGFFSPTRKLTRRTPAIELDVRPRPDGSSAWWLPAKKVTLESQWASPLQDIKIDKPLTRTILMRAEGVQDSQLPDIANPAIEGVSLYAEEPLRSTGASSVGLVAEQRINWALIPQRSGTVTLPAISVEWFNTETGKKQTATLPEEQIVVAGNPSSTLATNNTARADGTGEDVSRGDYSNRTGDDAAALNAGSGLPIPDSATATDTDTDTDTEEHALISDTLAEAESTGIQPVGALLSQRVKNLESSLATWRLLAVAALMLWLITGVYFMWRKWKPGTQHESHQNTARPGIPLSSIEKACQSGHLPEIKQTLLQWSERQWPDHAPKTLQALSMKLSDTAAGDTLVQLDGALYGQTGATPLDTNIHKAIKSLPSDLKAALKILSASEKTVGIGTRKRIVGALPDLD